MDIVYDCLIPFLLLNISHRLMHRTPQTGSHKRPSQHVPDTNSACLAQGRQPLQPSCGLRLKHTETEGKGKAAGQQWPCSLRGCYVSSRLGKDICAAPSFNSLLSSYLLPSSRYTFTNWVWGVLSATQGEICDEHLLQNLPY